MFDEWWGLKAPTVVSTILKLGIYIINMNNKQLLRVVNYSFPLQKGRIIMRFGHFHENPERGFFDQNGNFLRQESTNTVTENLKTGSEFLKKAGTFTPDPAAKAATENATSLLEAGENARKMLDEKKARMKAD